MSVPLDRLYHFLHDHCNHDVIIYHFYPHGSKKPENVTHLLMNQHQTKSYHLGIPVLFHDQEPLQFSQWTDVPNAFKIPGHPYPKIKAKLNRVNSYDKVIIVHSELNSVEVDQFYQDGAVPVYYWNHAVIARDWFRYAEHDKKLIEKIPKKQFLIYNRAWKGSREYRLKFADLLVDNNLQHECLTSFNPVDNEHYAQHNFEDLRFKPSRDDLENYFDANTAPSWASADYVSEDYQQTNIEVVLETLFNDTRWHITEKTLRAIAVGQPFILCASPGSLSYLRRYGFETFEQCWDESYDSILDPVERLHAIVQLMKTVKDSDMTQARNIAERNRQRFFSSHFMDFVVNEFTTNFAQAASEVKQSQSCAYFLRHCIRTPEFVNSVDTEVIDHIQKITGASL